MSSISNLSTVSDHGACVECGDAASAGIHCRDIRRAVIGREAVRICFCCDQRIGFGAEFYQQQTGRGVVVMHRVCPDDPFLADVGGVSELVESSAIGGPVNG